MSVRLYPYGFLGSTDGFENPHLAARGFREIETWDGLKLLVQSDTEVAQAGTSQLGIIWIGYGCDVRSAEIVSSMAEHALQYLSEGIQSFYELLDYVVGRWAAIVSIDGKLVMYNDALALQPVYIARDASLFGSHLPLVAEELSARTGSALTFQELGPKKLWDETEYLEVGALTANHCFDFAEKTFRRFYPHSPINSEGENYSERLDTLVRFVSNSVRYWASLPFKLYVALTAGQDTRLCTAATLNAGVEATYVTYGSTKELQPEDQGAGRSYKIDVLAARELAEAFGLDSKILAIEESRKFALSDEQKSILSANSLGKHAISFQGLYEKELGVQPSICFVGTGFELLREYYLSADKVITPENEFEKLIRALGGFSDAGNRRLSDDDLATLWNRENMQAVSEHGFPLSNLFYWELRGARFQSEAINCQATAFMPINPLAFRALFEVGQLLGFYERKASEFNRDFIARTFPLLSGYPVNGKQRQWTKIEYCQIPIFERFGSGSQASLRQQVPPDVLQLSDAHLCEGGEVFFSDRFNQDQGSLLIGYLNGYSIGREVRNVEVFLRVDGSEIWNAGIGCGGTPVHVAVNGLKQGNLVEFGVRSTRKNGIAWSNVSKTRLVMWESFELKYETDLKAVSTYSAS